MSPKTPSSVGIPGKISYDFSDFSLIFNSNNRKRTISGTQKRGILRHLLLDTELTPLVEITGWLKTVLAWIGA